MKLEDLISPIRIISMDHKQLLERIRGIRDARVNYVPIPKKTKAAKTRKKRKTDIEKILDKMDDNEKAAFIKMLKEGDNG